MTGRWVSSTPSPTPIGQLHSLLNLLPKFVEGEGLLQDADEGAGDMLTWYKKHPPGKGPKSKQSSAPTADSVIDNCLPMESDSE
jgi:hypothetical protein